MTDSLHSPDGNLEWPGDTAPRAPQTPNGPLSDREVPLPRRGTSPAIHSWLDGDIPEATVRQGDTGRQVDFWKQILAQAEVRREVSAPTHLQQRIMAALPQTVPHTEVAWWDRSIEVTMLAVVLGCSALVALGASLAFALLAP